VRRTCILLSHLVASQSAGAGGGGAGRAAAEVVLLQAGTTNTGGGGGTGTPGLSGYAGGSGIVIIRYKFQ
jgi:hypothetical protein